MEAFFEAVLGAILEPLLAVVGEVLLTLLAYAVGVPLVFVFCTPVVLVMACFGPGAYSDKVFSGYKGIWTAANL